MFLHTCNLELTWRPWAEVPPLSVHQPEEKLTTLILFLTTNLKFLFWKVDFSFAVLIDDVKY